MWKRLLCLALLTAAAAGCAAPPPPRLLRLIDPEPRSLLSADDLRTAVPVVAVDFEASTRSWAQLSPAEVMRPLPGGWPLRFTDSLAKLEWNETLDADQVQEIAVAIQDIRDGGVDLYWRRPDEEYSDDRHLQIRVQDAVGQSVKTFRFDLAGRPSWQGQIEALRFDVRFPGGAACILKRVTAARIAPDAQRAASAVRRPWKVDLQHQVRSARLAPPGSTFEREVFVDKGARLLAGYGVMPGFRGTVEFRISGVAPETGRVTLFSRTTEAEDPERCSWRDAVVDLSRFAGRQLKLVLEIVPVSDFEQGSGLPVWGDPMVVTPRRGRSPASVILMSADTLRADRMSLYGNERLTSPFIDRWARESAVVFRNVVVQAPWTLPSHVSMLTGLDAPRHGVNHDLKVVPEELVLMAELLRDAGWVTCAVTGGGFLHPRYGFDQGFDSYFYWPEKGSLGELEAVIQRAIDWMTTLRDVPCFLFVHSFEVHGPYRVRQPYYDSYVAEGAPPVPASAVVGLQVENPLRSEGFRALDQALVWQSGAEAGRTLRASEIPAAVALYDSGIGHLDWEFGRLLGHLRSLGIDDRTMVIFTSDHGEALGEHERGGHGYLYESNLLVPLIVEFPDRRGAGRVVSDQVRSIDIMPTVLDFVGVDRPQDIDGTSLLPLLAGDRSAAPGDAWTFASSHNLGLSLRVANRVKYTVNNTAWREAYGQQAVFDLDANPDDEHGEQPTDGDRRRIEERVRHAFAGAARGLSVTLCNAENAPLSGTIGGHAVQANGVKAWDMKTSTVDWIRRGLMSFRVVPDESLTLVFEKWDGGPITLRGAVEGSRVDLDEEIEPAAILEGTSIGLSPSGWVRSRGSELASGTRAVISVVGPPDRESGASLAEDEQLVEQLRALGYLQ